MDRLIIKIERRRREQVYWTEYSLDFQANKSVFWWLKKISAELDSTLAFECSCNSGLCGACAVLVNNRAVLSCKELVHTAATLTIRPLSSLPVVKDLVLDWRKIEGYLRTNNSWLFESYTPLSADYAMDAEATALDKRLAACISCGICVSVCPAFAQGGFEYPFVFTKGQRLMIDPNVPTDIQQQILANLAAKADTCIGCGACDRSCPKAVNPSASILSFR